MQNLNFAIIQVFKNKTIYRNTLMHCIYHWVTLYMTCNTFICTILFVILKSIKIIYFKDIVGKIIEVKVAGNFFFFPLFRDFDLNYLQDKIFKYGYLK